VATPIVLPSFATGEISPSLYGRVDVDRVHIACSTGRNLTVSYRGGLNSRPGSKFVGFSKQTGRNFPPRLIPFQFSVAEGLALEFGHHYMRVISDGAFVTETAVGIGSISQAIPAVITFGAQGATSATPNNGAVTFTYAPGDLVTLAGGVALSPAVLAVTSSELKSIVVNAHGAGYTVADTITLDGGTSAPAAVVTVATIVAVSATGSFTFAVNPSDGDTITLNGTVWTFKTTVVAINQTQIQSSLENTLAQLVFDLNASADVQVVKCTYTSNATRLLISFDVAGAGGNAFTLAASVATRSAATLTGGAADGLGTVTVTTPGIFTAVPPGGAMTQASSSGGGTGATFQTAVFAPHAVTVSNPGAYTTIPANPVAQASTTGVGVGATFTVIWVATAPFANDDWIFIQGVNGMTQVNGNTYRLSGVTATTANLLDAYGMPVDSTGFSAYISGGTAARIFTLTTPYAEEDLAWLKFTQSADVMTLCCVNQITGSEYVPQDLARFSDANWVFSPIITAETISPPPAITVQINDTNGATYYAYEVTSVSPDDGSESIASPIGRTVGVSLRDHINAQSNISWTVVPTVNQYNIYKAELSDLTPVPGGALFGYIGSAYGNQFVDKNYTSDFSQTPPRHQNPFQRGQALYITMTSGGSGYNQATAAATVTSGTGSGAILAPVVLNGAVVAIIVLDHGHDYQPGDTIAITGGTGAAAQLTVGPESGTYPSVPGYFQQRRVFAATLNLPDTYWMSQPSSFGNFDTRIPTIDSDSVTGSPWSVQVNGIQALLQTPPGLLVMTGQSAWLLAGASSFATNTSPISPDNQAAIAQPFTGCSATVLPFKVLYDVIYVTAKGEYYYDMPYQGYSFTEPLDLTEYATHLFTGYEVVTNAWCESPYKLLWSVRNDGTMQSLTFLKSEQVAGWTRHDTNGFFVSVCSISEPPVDALYIATERFPGTHDAYMIERLDDRIWPTVEDCWCVDCGLELAQPTPIGTLSASSAYGAGTITGVTSLVGGSGYSAATTATIRDEATDEDDQPIGSGATATLTIVGGVITAINITAPGANYRTPKLDIIDPENLGSGASAHLTLNTSATFTCTNPSFVIVDIGKVIRMGGGVATITAFTSTSQVTAIITTPISAVRTDTDGTPIPVPQKSGDWTLTRPVSQVSGLLHLANTFITGLADGKEITPRLVSNSGVVTLDEAASAIVIGLGFDVQFQSVYLDGGTPTVQGQRKKIGGVSVLLQNSLNVEFGQNQVDGSTLSPPQIAPQWSRMVEQPNLVSAPYNSTTTPLYTGWVRDTTQGGWEKNGQVALQQRKPFPLDLISLVPEILLGDTASQTAGGNGK
jgi:hypothetical protein